MSTTPEQINLWRSAASEHQRLEFKEAKTQFDFRTLCKYCVALANEGGGQLLFGIADKHPRSIVGTAAVNDPIGMAEKLFQTLGFRVDVEAVDHPDGRVVVFHIPSRPRGTAYHLEGTYSNPGDPIVPVDRFIDGYQSRNERLADLMRRFAICEEKGSGVDKVIQAIEAHQLPAPDFRAGFKRFSALLLAPRRFEDMDRNDRIRACYQHCCLCYVLHGKMTNQSLRERFKLPESKAESASRVIRETMEAGNIRLTDSEQTSLRYRSYVPFWG